MMVVEFQLCLEVELECFSRLLFPFPVSSHKRIRISDPALALPLANLVKAFRVVGYKRTQGKGKECFTRGAITWARGSRPSAGRLRQCRALSQIRVNYSGPVDGDCSSKPSECRRASS
jgi:hypothetical protein